MFRECRPVAVMLIALLTAPTGAFAQGPESATLPSGTTPSQDVVQDFSSLASRVQSGDQLIVEDAEGRSIRGRLSTLSPTELTLLGSGAQTTIEAARITVVTRAYRDPRWTGALVGLVVGAAFGAGLGRGLMHEYKQDVGLGDATVIALQVGAVGAGVGFLIDALVPGRKVVYRRAPSITQE